MSLGHCSLLGDWLEQVHKQPGYIGVKLMSECTPEQKFLLSTLPESSRHYPPDSPEKIKHLFKQSVADPFCLQDRRVIIFTFSEGASTLYFTKVNCVLAETVVIDGIAVQHLFIFVSVGDAELIECALHFEFFVEFLDKFNETKLSVDSGYMIYSFPLSNRLKRSPGFCSNKTKGRLFQIIKYTSSKLF